jgi:hypothetical protein
MPYRLKPDGSIEVDTPEELFEFQKYSAKKDPNSPWKHLFHEELAVTEHVDEKARWASFLKDLSPEQLKLIRIVYEAEEDVSITQLANALDWSRQGVGGNYGGIKKIGVRHGYQQHEILKRAGDNYLPGAALTMRGLGDA